MSVTSVPEIMTPEQAAAYLQVGRGMIYRYVREGKLLASRIGRGYRIPRESVELLLLATRTRPDIVLREYGDEEVAEFLRRDEIDGRTAAAIARFEDGLARTSTR
jgi:excisionase family DNA binding protein